MYDNKTADLQNYIPLKYKKKVKKVNINYDTDIKMYSHINRDFFCYI